MRIRQLQEKLNHLDGWMTEDPIEIFYLTGLTLSAGAFVCTKDKAMIYVDGRYTSYAKEKSSLAVGSDKAENFFSEGSTVGVDGSKMSVTRFGQLRKDIHWEVSASIIEGLRLIKDASEVALLKESAALAVKGMNFCLASLNVGVSEEEIARELDYFFKKEGGEGAAFDSIIAFGENSAHPHHRAGKRRLKNNEIVLIDIGATRHRYQSDMTRTLFFGEADAELKKIHAIVDRAQKAALNICKPGTKIGSLDDAARDLIAQEGYGPLFSHGLGHGLGLEVHEFPSLKNKEPFKDIALQPGMVVTIEPGIYREGLGGVRIEDTILITEQGYENLTCHVL